MWVFALLVLAVIAGIAIVAAGVGDPLAIEFDDRPDVVIPANGPVRAEDLTRLRFNTTFRGYRASEVDALLDRLAAQLAEAEARQPHPAATESVAELPETHDQI